MTTRKQWTSINHSILSNLEILTSSAIEMMSTSYCELPVLYRVSILIKFIFVDEMLPDVFTIPKRT